ncbi:hypothetical protein [Tuwongella immobilis]|uniref:Uncharacterized protein n=1 Tax=Tuwongella immobilis TaxID=692036 RepID=A0A6C2YT53_9BACT|nr:hypothetical protein [Tuwongella immobilis]VIP04313.1 Uncharacterized protein OS=Methylococcus capsulatus (strain ATCC 33009 / NCIMB 11132 / Bath) GN=MCA0776 PE=4 SV=1 [Tuwongella immobilis]VTS05988.1 Uncharacterized protein OS=Methylococcus capsulatus (strain ATCC 33009 / NCIMB 11132 / Bath) GN=MCA0776 PE=4 SV=1 [Tuwongella immobilis]
MNPTESAAVTALLDQLPLMPLGPGKPLRAFHAAISALRPETDFPTARDADHAQAALAGLWLAFNFESESHAISQDLPNATGSFWHGILHRREPDAWNAKYWFRQVGNHPVIAQLRAQSPALGYRYTTPEAFVDFVEQVRDTNSANEALAQRIQKLEWQLLFAWSFQG